MARRSYASLEQEVTQLREQVSALDDQRAVLEGYQESLSRLQLEIENAGYERLGSWDNSGLNNRRVLQQIIDLARVMYVKNATISRAVDVQADYIFSRGVQITAKDQALRPYLKKFWNHPQNRKAFSSQPLLVEHERELQITGNLFLAFFKGEGGVPYVRRVDVGEIQDIYCNPEDIWEPWFYKRVRSIDNVERVEWHPALGVEKGGRFKIRAGYSDADKPIVWDVPIYHRIGKRTGNMKFGYPEIYPSLDWALAYKRFLENWATIMAAYARLAMKVSGLQGKKGVEGAKSKLQTSISLDNTVETNPSATAGSWFLSGAKGVNVEAVKTAGATTPASEGQPLLNMAASGVGIPSTFFGNASEGNYATATTLDRPTELKFTSRQNLWKIILQDVSAYALTQQGQIVDDPEEITPRLPDILERNVTDRVRAVINAATGFGKPLNPDIIPDKRYVCRLVLTALQEENVEEVLDTFEAVWGDTKVPPIPTPVAGPQGAEDPSQGGDVGTNG